MGVEKIILIIFAGIMCFSAVILCLFMFYMDMKSKYMFPRGIGKGPPMPRPKCKPWKKEDNSDLNNLLKQAIEAAKDNS